ncbi:uncharacterized protein LOC125766888 [Anopheles funestus]|uniref:uncharacterized protein LOC125766888 n=1 Tax=Anopheles funestus TaxID=62324 RepID=UPI0020C679FD|nr:uncharacterized protein LOC125766888 [Anopheles funestus]
MPGRDEMLGVLSDAGIAVPPSATVAQIRRLFAEIMGIDATPIPDEEPASEAPLTDAPTTCLSAILDASSATPVKRDAAILDASSATLAKRDAAILDASSATLAKRDAAILDASSATLAKRDVAILDASSVTPVKCGAAMLDATEAERVDSAAKECNPANKCTQATYDDEIRRLQQQLELVDLRRKIQALEHQSEYAPPPIADLKLDKTIEPFTGDDDRCIIQWLDDLDYTFSLHRVKDADKFVHARRLLKGSAAIVAQSSRALTLEQLKEELISTLSVPPTVEAVLRQLRSRRLSPKETALRYVLDMQRIASRAPIPEPELINIILDGLDSPSLTAGMRFMANNLEDLKPMLKKFETIRSRRVPKPTTTSSSIPEKVPVSTNRGATQNIIRCYNCSEFGHLKSACSRPNRPPGACFTCFQMGHNYKNCPKKVANAAAHPDPITRIAGDDNETLALDELQEVVL